MSDLTPSETQTQLDRYDRLIQYLGDLSRRIAESTSLDESLLLALDAAAQLTGAISARLVLDGTRCFHFGLQDDRLFAADSIVHERCQAQAPMRHLLLNPVRADLPLAELQSVFVMIVAYPLQLHGGSVATLWLGFDAEPQFDDQVETLLDLLINQATIALNVALVNEAARAEHERLTALLVNDFEPIVIVDTDYRIRVFNPAAESLFDMRVDDAIGQPFEEVISSKALVDMLHVGTEAPADIEYASADGRTFSPHVAEVRSENQTLRGWLLVLRDVTRFKRLSENMSDFLHTVSHDIRSPLTAAKGFLDMIAMVGSVNEKQERFIGKILSSINDMTNLVEKVLDAGRLDPEMDAYDIRREPCDPSQIVNKVVSTLNSPAQEKGIALAAEVAPDVPIMNIDELMIERAMMNLVENAIKYTPDGGEVEVAARISDDNLVLSVSDNGYGIALEDQKRLFARGERIRRKEHKGIRGSGLGLFIVSNVARKHQGYATLDSVVGEGSTFSITIPLDGENLVGGQ
ncbi:MAG: PAS domain-containing protein [Chloroflexi bacterium]|nr:PAS domain-containing protein [Chloroflexota bacterium]